jgi:tetratricopeptide (TPR) repeat protein
LGEYNKAIELIDKKLQIKPSNHELIFLKGRSYLLLNEYQKASSSFLDAIAIQPKDKYFNGLGFAYTKLDYYNKSLAAYQKAISLNNKNNFAYFNSGLILENQGYFKKAGDYFYSAGTSSILNKDFTRANDSLIALERLAKKQKKLTNKKIKLDKLITEFTTDTKERIKIVKIKN